MKTYYPEKHSMVECKKGPRKKTTQDFSSKTHVFVIIKEQGFQKCRVYTLYFWIKETAYFQNWLPGYTSQVPNLLNMFKTKYYIYIYIYIKWSYSLLHFHKAIWPSHGLNFSFKNVCMFGRIHFLYKIKRLIYWYLKWR